MTRIPDAKLALAAMLAARPLLIDSGVLVRGGLPGKFPTQLERIYVDASSGNPQTPGHPAQELTAEAFTIAVVLETRLVSGDNPDGYAIAEARKWALYRELEAVIAQNGGQLGGAVWRSTVAVQLEWTRPTESGWFGYIAAGVRCEHAA